MLNGHYLNRIYPSGTGSSLSILILDCNLIFFCSMLRLSSFNISDIGLDLLRLLASVGILLKLVVGVDVGKVGIPGNLGNGCGPSPGIIIPGGKNGFCDSSSEGEGCGLEVGTC